MSDGGAGRLALTILVLAPVYLMGLLAAVDVVRRPEIGRGRKAAWLTGLVAFTPVTLVYLLARPVGDVGSPESARLGADDPRVRFTEAVEAGNLEAALQILADAEGPQPPTVSL